MQASPEPTSPREIQQNRLSPDFPVSQKQRVEDKLIQGRKATMRKIEEMRKKQQEEAKRLSPGKPVISQKSTDLAVKAEERFFSRHSPVKERLQQGEKQEKSPEKQANRLILRQFSQSFDRNTARSSPPRASSLLRTPLASSLLHLTSLQRNQLWLDRKSHNIAQQRQSLAQSALKECTFSPKICSKSPEAQRNRSTLAEKCPFPQAVDKFDRDVLRAVGEIGGFGGTAEAYKSLSPFKVTLGSFRPESFIENRKKTEQITAISKPSW